jgi:hypothetical protein
MVNKTAMLYSPITQSEEIVSAYNGLRNARTYRDIYSLSAYPHKIADLARPEEFDAFEVEMHGSGMLAQSKTIGTQLRDGRITWDGYRQSFESQEVISLFRDFEHANFSPICDDGTRQWKAETRRQIGAFDYNPGGEWHADGINKPEMRLYMAANKTPSLVVSHADTLDIFEKHNPRFLDRPLPADEFGQREFLETVRAMKGLFREAAKPLDPYAAYVATGATIHARDANTPDGRVFSVALVL